MKRLPDRLFIAIFALVIMSVGAYAAQAAIRSEGGGGPEILAPRPVQYLTIIGHREKGEFATGVEPFRELRLQRFTQVIWQSRADVPVLIRLGNGKTCKQASQGEFLYLGSEFLMAKCYVTQKPIPPGGAMQTEFREQGRFHYEVEYVGENTRETGVILVY
jgi:hypothetical protein